MNPVLIQQVIKNRGTMSQPTPRPISPLTESPDKDLKDLPKAPELTRTGASNSQQPLQLKALRTSRKSLQIPDEWKDRRGFLLFCL